MKSIKNTLGTILLASGLAIGISGCIGDPTPNSAASLNKTNHGIVINSGLEGRIIKIQPGSLSFIGTFRGTNGSYGSQNHEVEYVFVNDASGHTKKLIYPLSYGLLEGDVRLSYTPIAGMIGTDAFIKQYINENYTTDDDFPLYADGIIIPNSIRYK